MSFSGVDVCMHVCVSLGVYDFLLYFLCSYTFVFQFYCIFLKKFLTVFKKRKHHVVGWEECGENLVEKKQSPEYI